MKQSEEHVPSKVAGPDSVLPVVFLDFDGVLNSWAWWARQRNEPRDGGVLGQVNHDNLLDPAAVGLVNQLVARTGARVVISSTWRLNREMRAVATLERCGFIGEIIGQTPALNRPRGHEIQEWLDLHSRRVPFVILDDDSDMVHLTDRLVKTSMATGITQAHVDRAVVLLGGPEPKPEPGQADRIDTEEQRPLERIMIAAGALAFAFLACAGLCALAYNFGERAAILREYTECVNRFGPMVPSAHESCGSMIGAQHGEEWRTGWP